MPLFLNVLTLDTEITIDRLRLEETSQLDDLYPPGQNWQQYIILVVRCKDLVSGHCVSVLNSRPGSPGDD